MSRILALLGLFVTVPVMLVIALLVMISMGRPVIFRQRRSGKDGTLFTLIKFRSMNDKRDAQGELLPDGERVTGFGRFLRRSRLDELPGLWNVAKGDLAFVGPRPLLPQTISDLGELGRKRGKVAPGLTGWAQVNGNTLLNLRQKVALDLWYVDHRNAWLDTRILWRTVLVMVGGERLPEGRGKETPT